MRSKIKNEISKRGNKQCDIAVDSNGQHPVLWNRGEEIRNRLGATADRMIKSSQVGR